MENLKLTRSEAEDNIKKLYKKKEIEEKFIVINKQHLIELLDVPEFVVIVSNFKKAMDVLSTILPQNKYYVVNRDEPYAQQVVDLILGKNECSGKGE